MGHDHGLHTNSVHAGQRVDPATGARAPPLYQTTSYAFEDSADAAGQFALERDGYIYSRLMNPTVETLQDRLAALEGGVGAVATASGMAALDLATFLLARAGDSVVAASDLYGGTVTYLTHSAQRRGVDTTFVDVLDYDAYADAIDADTAYVLVETVGNPSLITPDLERIADIAHDNGVPLLVDNTFATPALATPIDHGADIVWHSTTKWIHGAGTTVGGALVDAGSFDWDAHAADYPEIAQENPAYHGVTFTDRFGDAAFTYAAIARGLRDLGNQQSPFDAWQTLQKLETLPLRMQQHCRNAQLVAEHLRDHPNVSWVNYPGLADHDTHDNATTYLDSGYGGMLTFGVEDGYDAAQAVTEETTLASLLANVGDAKTLVIHPASTTHQQLTPEAQRAGGVRPEMVRVSVGIEDPADIVADLETAIEAAVGSA
ncbi:MULTISPECIES: O-acetylhomoserine aminocarboxypropyltransferase/cysteine synthase family protein [Halobacterium]|uniref:O-acetylhomoserine aminocarboxypropyltransferase/cysteine synthase family protein n=1 Tax=Halobacterium TaxID=2239 RepID=UPI0019653324|nr:MULTISPECIES: O-acetylhomoserine aminocarboxypropyltransferase/cysteine synthase family protein [Halobacterium]MDL0123676.1 O-acetylhomoserine aminocarboxypropyltransferase/cysteine synthase [Halobacterium salinarum]QRY22570.1 O-acetylhomoserine aminocarboxypropyltransferase/cysteine synthase [Halobacterium sp. GSL-19]QRY24635.1 O-acetylhomoserine aminocarboxypropyltransferase/cysteine synthase [Halobacterium sp. BOL4-2]